VFPAKKSTQNTVNPSKREAEKWSGFFTVVGYATNWPVIEPANDFCILLYTIEERIFFESSPEYFLCSDARVFENDIELGKIQKLFIYEMWCSQLFGQNIQNTAEPKCNI
jgi:hypothetical protein